MQRLGFHRGGNALRVDYCFLEDGEISIHDDRWLTYPWGVNGGEPGKRSIKVMYRGGYGTGKIEYHRSKCDNIKVKKDDILSFITWGGGGWGWGIDRDAELVAADVRRGLVTVEGAKRYGVVMNSDGNTINASATQSLRDQMRAKQPATPPVFDKGPPMAEILANCEKETHMVAPRPPVFRPGTEHAKAAE